MGPGSEYPDYRKLLRAAFDERLKANPAYTMSQFARDLELSASRLAAVLAGRQGLSRPASLTIANLLQMNEAEVNYFADLVEYRDGRSAEKRELARLRLHQSAVAKDYHVINEDAFHVVSDWYHFPIVELFDLEGFRSDPAWIAQALNIGTNEVIEALDRLERLGVIARDDEGKLKRNKELISIGDTKVPSSAIREFHQQILRLAADAIYKQSLEERNLSANILAIDKKSINKAREKLKRFRRNFTKEFSANTQKKNSIYCLSFQLFELTKRKNEAA